MATYKELLAQQKVLEDAIKAAHAHESSGAVKQVQAIIAEFGLTADDVFGGAKRAGNKAKGTTVAAKYRDPKTGATWTGRGKPPRWIADQDREKFII
jgi:DNA-binding protein H-NS